MLFEPQRAFSFHKIGVLPMRKHRIPQREKIFVASLLRHGYRQASSINSYMKYRKGYVIQATDQEDAAGIDFWIKPPNSHSLFPIQITQRGCRLAIIYQASDKIVRTRDFHLSTKAQATKRCGSLLVLIRDFWGDTVNEHIAFQDMRALAHALKHQSARAAT